MNAEYVLSAECGAMHACCVHNSEAAFAAAVSAEARLMSAESVLSAGRCMLAESTTAKPPLPLRWVLRLSREYVLSAEC